MQTKSHDHPNYLSLARHLNNHKRVKVTWVDHQPTYPEVTTLFTHQILCGFGNVNFIQDLQRQSCVGHSPVAWLRPSNFEYSKLLGAFKDEALNGSQYIIQMAGHITCWPGSPSIFLRPNSGMKPFGGMNGVLADLRKNLSETCIDDGTLVVLSPTREDIVEEARIIMSFSEPITGSLYRRNGQRYISNNIDDSYFKYVRQVIRQVGWFPDDIYAIDVAKLSDGTHKIVEFSSINCCGLYACDLEKVAAAIVEELRNYE